MFTFYTKYFVIFLTSSLAAYPNALTYSEVTCLNEVLSPYAVPFRLRLNMNNDAANADAKTIAETGNSGITSPKIK